jgi:hypothetical protein
VSHVTALHRYIVAQEMTVSAPISVRLDADIRETLESEARVLGVGLASYLRQLATKAAHAARRARSARVTHHAATDRVARHFMDDWGTPDAEAM